MCAHEIEEDPVVRIRVHDIIESLRLNRVDIRNLPISDYAEYLIQNEIGLNDFLYFVPTYTVKQPYFMRHVHDLFDTVMGIQLERYKELENKYNKAKEYYS